MKLDKNTKILIVADGNREEMQKTMRASTTFDKK